MRKHPTPNLRTDATGAGFSEQWLDKQEVLQLLHISPRTLQRWRDMGLMPFSFIGGKMFFRKSVIESILYQNEQVRVPKLKEGKRY